MGCWRGNDSIAVTGVIQETAAEVALAQEGLYYELICDSAGMHVKPANLRLTLRAAGAENIILITDANIGQYRLEELSEDDMRRRYPDLNFNSDGELSGSRLTMELAVKNMRRHTGATVDVYKRQGLWTELIWWYMKGRHWVWWENRAAEKLRWGNRSCN